MGAFSQHRKSDQYNRPVSQSHTVNIIGISIEPIIRIGAKDESDYIEVNGKTIVPIQNESNFDIPVCIEIDSGIFSYIFCTIL